MYPVIEFIDENAVEAAPSKWIISTKKNKVCFWPAFKGKQLRNALVDCITPDFQWQAHSCRVIKEGLGK